jgi:hypothetical protein
MNPSLKVIPMFSQLGRAETSAVFVARLDPPETRFIKRPKVSIVLAIDESGSMRGLKLASATSCAQTLISALRPSDRVAVVTFNSCSSTLIQPTSASDPEIRAKLADLWADGGTDLSQGIRAALAVAKRMGPGTRVIALTDGVATRGTLNREAIVAEVREALGETVLSTFGYGYDTDPILLYRLSTEGHGNFAFIVPSEPPLAAMASEYGSLVSAAVNDVTLTITPARGVHVSHILRTSPARQGAQPGDAVLDLPALLDLEPAYVAFRLDWTVRQIDAPLAHLVLRGSLAGTGEAVQTDCEASASFGEHRQTPNPEAIKQVTLGRIALLLHRVSQGNETESRALIHDLDQLTADARAYVAFAELESDAQLTSAFEVLKQARYSLIVGDMNAFRHDAVAHAASVERARACHTGYGFHHDEVTSVTQLRALNELLGKYTAEVSGVRGDGDAN